MRFLIVLLSVILLSGCFDFKIERNKKKDQNETQHAYTPEQLELKSYLDIYFMQLQNLDTESIIDMTYPKLFTHVNKTVFKQYINTLLTSKHINIESFDTKLISLGEVQPYSNGEFAQINYMSTIKLNFINPKLYSDDLSIRILNDVLSRKYGKENIDINPIERTIVIKKEEKLIAIKDHGCEWKFVGDNSAYRTLYPRFLLPDLLTKI